MRSKSRDISHAWRWTGGGVVMAVLACGVGAYGAERVVLGEYFTMIG